MSVIARTKIRRLGVVSLSSLWKTTWTGFSEEIRLQPEAHGDPDFNHTQRRDIVGEFA
jgi:hypothetical protein